MDYSDRFVFLASYYQKEASLDRKLYLYYYPADTSLELFDLKTKKTFLKRCKLPQVSEFDLFIGAKLMIYGRQVNILDFGDASTRRRLAAKRQKSFLAIKPHYFSCTGKILDILVQSFTIQRLKLIKIDQGLAEIMFDHMEGERMLPSLIQEFTQGLTVVIEVAGDDSVNRLMNLVGTSAEPDDEKPSNRLLFGQDKLRMAVYVAKTLNQVETCVRTFFGEYSQKPEPVENGSTLCVIKPHAVKEGNAGKIIDAIIAADLRIVCMKMCYLERSGAEEFYEVYKGVVPEYTQMSLQLSSGPCIAMEILGKTENSNAYLELRSLCGPMDPEIAQQVRPHTLRAKFGQNKIQNAVHCTDLEEDASLEVEYFFRIID